MVSIIEGFNCILQEHCACVTVPGAKMMIHALWSVLTSSEWAKNSNLYFLTAAVSHNV